MNKKIYFLLVGIFILINILHGVNALAPNRTWVDISPKINVSSSEKPYAYAYFHDMDSASASAIFAWHVNGVNVENDSLTMANNTPTKSYLNATLNKGDIVNLTFFVDDGSGPVYKYWERTIWYGDYGPVLGLKPPSDFWNHYYTIYEIPYCDSNFCYGGKDFGALVKFDKFTGETVWSINSPSLFPFTLLEYYNHPINRLYCNATSCFGGTQMSAGSPYTGGNLSWAQMDTYGTRVWSYYDPVSPIPNINILSIYCDSNFCYTGHQGYIAKTWFNKTTVWGNGSGQQVVAPYGVGNYTYDLKCDSSFCYGIHTGGYVSKTWKSNGTILWGTGAQIVKPASSYGRLFCENDYCFLSASGIKKIDKNTGEIIYNVSTSSNGIFCDSYFCYLNPNGYKVWKGSGTQVLGSSSISSGRTPYINYPLSFCDDYYCYGGNSGSLPTAIGGKVTKVYMGGDRIIAGGDGNLAPTLYAFTTSPETVNESTDIIINATCQDGDNNFGNPIIGFSRIWLNKGSGYFQNGTDNSEFVLNNTNTKIYNYSSSNFEEGDSIKIEIWCGDTEANSTHQNTSEIILSGGQCSPSPNVDWIIIDAQVCDATNVGTGTGIIIIDSGGSLILTGSSNISAKGLDIRRTGDSVFIKTGSKLRVV